MRKLVYLNDEYDEMEYSDDKPMKQCLNCGWYDDYDNFTDDSNICDRCVKKQELCEKQHKMMMEMVKNIFRIN